ncbi:hypothetical protein Nepgr_018968 [Nepenthes gracilis]|uniref:Transcriptional corepressor SEUSS n=1 Tax=Nepenthes gracilis TaxID=150966 RepID=A0AAD3XTL8_NEPGR|nr:hypothetical protein Nepgr_018968 [Nepenthes gracilis]
MLGGQGGPMPSQAAFASIVSPRTQYNNVNLLESVPNVSSLLNQSFGNGSASSGLSGSGSSQRGAIDTGAESDPVSGVGNGMGINPSSSSFMPTNMANPSSSGHVQGQQFTCPSGNQMLPDQQLHQQLEPLNFEHAQRTLQQFTAPFNSQSQQHQQCQSICGGLGNVAPVKLEPQMTNDQHGQQQQLQALRSLDQVKLEPQQLQTTRSRPHVKMEPQHSDQSLFLQQQQQQLLQMSMARQTSQASAAAQLNLLHQQRLLQLQQQQQQNQLVKALPQQRSQLQQQYQAQNLAIRSPVKQVYEPGMCARRLTYYMYQQRQRPEDNNIEFWRKFVTEFFAPNAKKKWCVSMYGSGRQTAGVFPQDVWHCEICNRKPGRGFEATVEVLPRLFKIKYESGTSEEFLYVDMPREYQNSSGQIVLYYAKAIQESVFEQLRVVRDGQLRIVFSPDLKICSWEFCARCHEELIPRTLLIPQVSQLGAAAQKYQAVTQNASSNISITDLQSNCNMIVASARQLMKALEVPLVNDLGYTKRYIRCLQISEVVNSMKDLIDYSRFTGAGPVESLAKFPQRTSTSSGPQGKNQTPKEQRQQPNDPSSVQAAVLGAASSNDMATANNSLTTTSASTSSTITGLLHQNSMNLRPQNPMSNGNIAYGGSSMPSSPFQPQQPPTNLLQTSNSANSAANVSMQQPALSIEGMTNDSQISVQKIIQEMMMTGQLNSAGGMMGLGSSGNDLKEVSSNVSMNSGNYIVANGPTNRGVGFGGMDNGNGHSAVVNGIRAAMGRDQSMKHQQQGLGNHLLSGLRAVNGFSNLQFDWKQSP